MATVDARARPVAQQNLPSLNATNGLLADASRATRARRLPILTAYLVSAVFILASCATNAIYGWHRGGADLPSAIVWAAVSIAASLGLALAWPAVLSSVAHRRWSHAGVALVALALFGTYSVCAALGSAAGGRLTSAAIEHEQTNNRARLTRQLSELQRELEALPLTRPPGELKALIAGKMAEHRLGNCQDWQRSTAMRAVCVEVGKLKAELARAERRHQLSAAVGTTTAEMAQLPVAKPANSDAAALVGYLKALGMEADADVLNRLLVLLAVLTIECGGGLALAVGMALGGRPEPAPRLVCAHRGMVTTCSDWW